MMPDRRQEAIDLLAWGTVVAGGTLAAIAITHVALDHASQIWALILLVTL